MRECMANVCMHACVFECMFAVCLSVCLSVLHYLSDNNLIFLFNCRDFVCANVCVCALLCWGMVVWVLGFGPHTSMIFFWPITTTTTTKIKNIYCLRLSFSLLNFEVVIQIQMQVIDGMHFKNYFFFKFK